MEALRSEYARKKIAGVLFSEHARYAYLWNFERYALHGPSNWADSIYFVQNVKNSVEFCTIKDELCPGWREKEVQRNREQDLLDRHDERAAQRRERQEAAQERKAWLASGGLP